MGRRLGGLLGRVDETLIVLYLVSSNTAWLFTGYLIAFAGVLDQQPLKTDTDLQRMHFDRTHICQLRDIAMRLYPQKARNREHNITPPVELQQYRGLRLA